MEFKTEATFESIGDAIGRTLTVDLDHSRVQVVVDAFKELCFETTIDFTGGEFYDGEEAPVSLRYEKLFGYCQVCGSLCHKDDVCPLDVKNTKKSPEKKREGRPGGKKIYPMRKKLSSLTNFFTGKCIYQNGKCYSIGSC